MKGQFTARYKPEDGNWLVEVDEIPQVHSFGPTLARAKINIRDALALWLQLDDPSALSLRDEVSGLPADVLAEIAEASESRSKADQFASQAQSLTADAARRLVRDLGVSMRDTAHLLNISHQRVHQLVRETASSAR